MLSQINVGTGTDVTISELGEIIAKVVGFARAIKFDADEPDGARKLLDVSQLAAFGWRASIALRQGIARTCRRYLANKTTLRAT